MLISSLRRDFQVTLSKALKLDLNLSSLEADLLILSELDPVSLSRTTLIKIQTDTCADDVYEKLKAKLDRRLSGEPLAYIIKSKEFYSNLFFVDQRVLIPRPETEILVAKCIDQIKKYKNKKILVVDLGSGSGAIILSILAEYNKKIISNGNTLRAVAVELSEDAVDVIKINAERLNLLSSVEIVSTCMFSFLKSEHYKNLLSEAEVVVVVSNPPYLDFNDPEVLCEVRKFEPASALFSNNQGFQHLIEIISLFVETYSRYQQGILGCNLYLEIGYNQSARLLSYANKFEDFRIEIYKDLASLDRVFSLQSK